MIIVFVGGILFFLGYRFYARKLESLWSIDPKRITPAYSKYDSLDYIPAKNWLVLFGHHFSSIAGAGPIIGPVIAVVLWGWFPALLWVILGTIFIGGVHDFGSLITSVREGGSSIADISQSVISPWAKVIFSLFVWLTLILVIAVFAYICADTFVKQPKIVMPSLGLIPVAILIGFLLYNLRLNVVGATILGLICLAGLIFWGNILPIKSSLIIWLTILLVYSYFASVLPVNILLQPRDYLSSFLLFFGLAVGLLGLLISHPTINMPYYHRWTQDGDYLWPALFVTVACGAVSGFHSLIASGTSSKQIANERHTKRIGYGGMVAEGLLAIIAIIATAVLFNTPGDFNTILKNTTPVDIFGRGYSLITQRIFGGHGLFLAIIILNAFILTTLDTATRIARYLTQELFKIKNHYLSSLVVIILGGTLAFSGKWIRIWPSFGASNQLVAALTLFVMTCWLLSKNKSAKFTLWPAVFMFVTTVVALMFQIIKYFRQRDILLLLVVILLLLLAAFMIWDVIPVILGRRKVCPKV